MNRNIEEFAKWLGLKPGKKYLLPNDNRPVIVDKYYNYYYEGEMIGNSLINLSLADLLAIVEIKEGE